LEPCKTNPRKGFDRLSIEGLAASIRADGLLQNLVVKPVNRKGAAGRFRIVSGERRYRALKLLAARGDLPEDFTVPVEVRGDLSADDSLRLATVENLQRQNLEPLEEAAALTRLVKGGVKLDDVVARTGLSATTIKRRLALNGLSDETRAALREGEITLSQAEALTLGDHEQQAHVLDEIRRGYSGFDAEDIRSVLIDDRPSAALAIFPVEQYSGSFTTDLFAEAEETYFDDAEAFFALQKEAVAELAKQHAVSADWVEVTDAYRIPDWQYREAGDGEPSGVLINLAPNGKVEVREGLARREVEASTAKALAEHPAMPKKLKATYAAPLRRYIAHHKTAAVQEVLLADPRKAKEVAVVALLTSFKPHEAIPALAKEPEPQAAYAVLEAQARLYADKLGFEIEDNEPLWSQFPPVFCRDVALYEAVKALSDHDLDGLHTLLVALAFGQAFCDRLDARESLFNRVAQDLDLDMKNHWRPDAAFLSRRNREQLIQIAKASGFADGRSNITTYKKAELVSGLLRYFADAHGASEPTEVQQKARAWLPEAMAFPAVDPDAPESAEDEGETADADDPDEQDEPVAA
jgi:ParB family chromosome partitioning protein